MRPVLSDKFPKPGEFQWGQLGQRSSHHNQSSTSNQKTSSSQTASQSGHWPSLNEKSTVKLAHLNGMIPLSPWLYKITSSMITPLAFKEHNALAILEYSETYKQSNGKHIDNHLQMYDNEADATTSNAQPQYYLTSYESRAHPLQNSSSWKPTCNDSFEACKILQPSTPSPWLERQLPTSHGDFRPWHQPTTNINSTLLQTACKSAVLLRLQINTGE